MIEHFNFLEHNNLVYGLEIEINDIKQKFPRFNDDEIDAILRVMDITSLNRAYFMPERYNSFRIHNDVTRFKNEKNSNRVILDGHVKNLLEMQVIKTVQKNKRDDLLLTAQGLEFDDISNITPGIIVYKGFNYIINDAYIKGVISHDHEEFDIEMLIHAAYNERKYGYRVPYPWNSKNSLSFKNGYTNEKKGIHKDMAIPVDKLIAGKTLVLLES